MSDIETGIMLYLDYIKRRLKEDETFEPHPIIKAIALALEVSKGKPDGNYMGLSGIPANGDSFKEMYAAVINKQRGRYIILSVEDFTTKRSIPPDIVVQLLHISMRLDKVKGKSVKLTHALKILNEIIENVKFRVMSADEIGAAKRNAIEQVKAGKVKIPPAFNHLIEALKNFRIETPWGDLDPSLRSFIGALWASKKYPDQSTIIITQILEDIEKYRVIELAKSRLLMR